MTPPATPPPATSTYVTLPAGSPTLSKHVVRWDPRRPHTSICGNHSRPLPAAGRVLVKAKTPFPITRYVPLLEGNWKLDPVIDIYFYLLPPQSGVFLIDAPPDPVMQDLFPDGVLFTIGEGDD